MIILGEFQWISSPIETVKISSVETSWTTFFARKFFVFNYSIFVKFGTTESDRTAFWITFAILCFNIDEIRGFWAVKCSCKNRRLFRGLTKFKIHLTPVYRNGGSNIKSIALKQESYYFTGNFRYFKMRLDFYELVRKRRFLARRRNFTCGISGRHKKWNRNEVGRWQDYLKVEVLVQVKNIS